MPRNATTSFLFAMSLIAKDNSRDKSSKLSTSSSSCNLHCINKHLHSLAMRVSSCSDMIIFSRSKSFVQLLFSVSVIVVASTTALPVCTEENNCRGTFADLCTLSVERNATFTLIPDSRSSSCSENDSISVISANETAELKFRNPNVQLKVVPECIHHRLVKESPISRDPSDPFLCSILKLHQGNIKLSGLIFDNAHCVQKHQLRGRVERAALLIRPSRYFENTEFTDVEFKTYRIEDGEYSEIDKVHVGVHVSPIRGENYLYLDNVVFSHVKHAAVKCDRCAGNVTAFDVPLLEVFQAGGAFNATGNNFTLFDVNSVVTDAILAAPCGLPSSSSIVDFASNRASVTKYVVISLLSIFMISISIELLQHVNRSCNSGPVRLKNCREHVVAGKDDSYVGKNDVQHHDHAVLRPLLSSSSSSSSSTLTSSSSAAMT